MPREQSEKNGFQVHTEGLAERVCLLGRFFATLVNYLPREKQVFMWPIDGPRTIRTARRW